VPAAAADRAHTDGMNDRNRDELWPIGDRLVVDVDEDQAEVEGVRLGA